MLFWPEHVRRVCLINQDLVREGQRRRSQKCRLETAELDGKGQREADGYFLTSSQGPAPGLQSPLFPHPSRVLNPISNLYPHARFRASLPPIFKHTTPPRPIRRGLNPTRLLAPPNLQPGGLWLHPLAPAPPVPAPGPAPGPTGPAHLLSPGAGNWESACRPRR